MSNIQVRDFSAYTDLLPVQFNDSENVIKLLSIYLDQVEELNLAQQELSSLSTDINTATGYQLDIIGNLLGARREGRLDADYRNYIRFRISINTGSGTPEDVIGFVKSVTGASKVRYWEHYPACTILETNGTNIPEAIPSTIDNVTPAGVKTGGVIIVEDGYAFRPCRLSEAYLNYTDRPPTGTVVDIDLGDDNAEVGGQFIECAQSSEIGGYTMGEEEAYMGNPEFEMVGGVTTGEFVFAGVNKSSFLGQSILPNLKEAYTNVNNLAGQAYMLAGNVLALSAGNTLSPASGTGILANVLTDKIKY